MTNNRQLDMKKQLGETITNNYKVQLYSILKQQTQ